MNGIKKYIGKALSEKKLQKGNNTQMKLVMDNIKRIK